MITYVTCPPLFLSWLAAPFQAPLRSVSVHSGWPFAQVEEEIFYPEVREAIDDDLYDARATVLGDYIDHHVKEEREEIFVKARKSRLDLVAMADELSQRKNGAACR